MFIKLLQYDHEDQTKIGPYELHTTNQCGVN
jgi:hypothetical protein